MFVCDLGKIYNFIESISIGSHHISKNVIIAIILIITYFLFRYFYRSTNFICKSKFCKESQIDIENEYACQITL